jgi:hypothetical protein
LARSRYEPAPDRLVAAFARPLAIPEVMTLRTLADVRELLGHLPKGVRERSTWQRVAAQLDLAARGGADPADVSVAMRLDASFILRVRRSVHPQSEAWVLPVTHPQHRSAKGTSARVSGRRSCRPEGTAEGSGENEAGRRSSAKLLTRDEAFLLAVNFAKLPSVPRQILKDIPRPPNSASRDD